MQVDIEEIKRSQQQYVGTKQLLGSPLKRGSYNALRGWDTPPTENPNDEGYLTVDYASATSNHSEFSGYISWLPKGQFEGIYHNLNTEGLTFGVALEKIKQGQRVSRAGWNGTGMFVCYVPAASYPVQTGAAKEYFGEGAKIPYNAYFAIKTANETVGTWAPSVSDCLAEDWFVVS